MQFHVKSHFVCTHTTKRLSYQSSLYLSDLIQIFRNFLHFALKFSAGFAFIQPSFCWTPQCHCWEKRESFVYQSRILLCYIFLSSSSPGSHKATSVCIFRLRELVISGVLWYLTMCVCAYDEISVHKYTGPNDILTRFYLGLIIYTIKHTRVRDTHSAHPSDGSANLSPHWSGSLLVCLMFYSSQIYSVFAK